MITMVRGVEVKVNVLVSKIPLVTRRSRTVVRIARVVEDGTTFKIIAPLNYMSLVDVSCVRMVSGNVVSVPGVVSIEIQV